MQEDVCNRCHGTVDAEMNSRIWRLEQQQRSGGGGGAAEAAVEHLHQRSAAPFGQPEQTGSDSAAAEDGLVIDNRPGRGSSGSIVSDATRAARAARAGAIRPKLAARRNRLAMLRRTPAAHSEVLARSNAVHIRFSRPVAPLWLSNL